MNWKVITLIAALVIAGIAATIYVVNNPTNATECGITICSEFNQEYRGWTQDTLQCTFNYAQFGYPGVSEVFSFEINQSTLEEYCPQG